MNYYGVATHPFEAGSERELGFQTGDRILLFNWDDPEWWYGELNGRSGYFPSSFVELTEGDDVPPPPPPPPEEEEIPPPPPISEDVTGAIPTAVGIWDCTAESEFELSFRAGDSLLILEESNNEWLFAELKGKRGYIPRNFVELKPATTASTTTKRPAASASAKPRRPDASTLPRNVKDDPNKVVAIYDFNGGLDQLNFKAGDFISVTSRDDRDWWEGEFNGKKGSFPRLYVDSPSPAAFELIEKNNHEDAIVTPPPLPQSKGSLVSHNPNLIRSASSNAVPAPAISHTTASSAPTSTTTSSFSSSTTPSSSSTKTATSSTASASKPASSISKATKTCAKCKEAIPGAFMEVDGAHYHKSCFVCTLCGTGLRKFMEKDGKLYCSSCFVNKVENDPCGKCGKPLGTTVVKACGKRLHDECFVCFKCNRPFNDNIVNNRDGEPWCDYCCKLHTPTNKPIRSTGAPPPSKSSPSGKAAPKVSTTKGGRTIQVEKKKFVSGFDY